MGGLGSGRRWHFSAKDTTDAYRALDIRRWAREGYLQPGSNFVWQWASDGETVASIRGVVEHTESLRLIYKTKSRGGDWRNMDYLVSLDRTCCHFGGNRVWFLCPVRGCGRRVAKLYGGAVFACRHCHDLQYPSQRENASDRAARRCEHIRARLGWHGSIFDGSGPKPKGMHWRTFERLKQEADLEAKASCALMLTRIADDPFAKKLLRDVVNQD